MTDSGLLYLAYRATEEWNWQAQALAIAALILWMILSKTLKLLGHLCRFPRDFWLLPTSIGFGYFHGLIKCYAFFTLHVVSRSLSKLSSTWSCQCRATMSFLPGAM